jgi:plastocyanin/mono/diheme cytochrome c family protein
MNTSKQVNVMIGLLLLAFVGFAVYIATEPARQADAGDTQEELFAYRGADIFVHSCANCHGPSGQGTEEGGLAPRLRRNAFLILDADNPWNGPETPIGDANEIHEFIFNTVACGRANTVMPVWSERYGGPLSEIQIEYITTMITTGRWDLVEEIWHAYEEELREAKLRASGEEWTLEGDFLTDPEGLSTTAANCGQYPGTSANDIRTRDPFAEGPAAPVDPTEEPGGPGTGDGPAVVMQDIAFAETAISIPGNEAVDVQMVNEGVLAHDFSIDEIQAEYEVTGDAATSADWDIHVALGPGGQAVMSVTVSEPGEYTFYCSVPGHREAGMEGTLSVE